MFNVIFYHRLANFCINKKCNIFFFFLPLCKQVMDMATVLNALAALEKIDIPASQLASTHLVSYTKKLRRHTTNKYLSNRLRTLLQKWRQISGETNSRKM